MIGSERLGSHEDIWIGKYDPDGELLWSTSWDNGGTKERGEAIALDSNGDVIAAGWTHNGTDRDVWLQKLAP